MYVLLYLVMSVFVSLSASFVRLFVPSLTIMPLLVGSCLVFLLRFLSSALFRWFVRSLFM